MSNATVPSPFDSPTPDETKRALKALHSAQELGFTLRPDYADAKHDAIRGPFTLTWPTRGMAEPRRESGLSLEHVERFLREARP